MPPIPTRAAVWVEYGVEAVPNAAFFLTEPMSVPILGRVSIGCAEPAWSWYSSTTSPDEEWLRLESGQADRRLGREVMTMQGAAGHV